MKRAHWTGLALVLILFASCREKEVTPELSAEQQIENQIKDKILEVMDDFYFWREEMPGGINPQSFSTFQDLVSALMYRPIDRWTYITTSEEFDALTRQGQFAGHGYVQSIDANGDLRIGAVFKNSPAERAGFRRSTKILEVNGQDVQSLLASNTLVQVMGAREVGISNTFKIEQADGSVQTVTVGKELVTQNTVMHHEIFEINNGKKIGYLVFMAFREPSIGELQPVFQQFKAEGISDLILDLRYNGGGFVNVAQFMANVIAPSSANGMVLARYAFNNKQSAREELVRISNNELKLNLNSLVALTGPNTASASELLVNGLDPFMDVQLVGERTGGKPVGAFVITIGNQTLVPITFKTVNANGIGDYYEGMEVNHQAPDGLDRDWGDPEEARLKEALYYLEKGAFRSGTSMRLNSNLTWTRNRNLLKGFQAEIGAF
jgi:C-terminal processing protease CtpA/Prc